MSEDLLTVQDAAREAGVSETGIRNAMLRGRLPFVLRYGRKLIERSAWEEYRLAAYPGRRRVTWNPATNDYRLTDVSELRAQLEGLEDESERVNLIAEAYERWARMYSAEKGIDLPGLPTTFPPAKAKQLSDRLATMSDRQDKLNVILAAFRREHREGMQRHLDYLKEFREDDP